MKITLKLKYKNIKKRITILLKKGIIYKQLLKLSKQLFPSLNTSFSSSSSLSFVWIDDENDLISISSEYEIYEAIQFMKNYKNGYINLEIIENQNEQDNNNSNNNSNNNLFEDYLKDIPLPIIELNCILYQSEFIKCQSILLNNSNEIQLTQIFTIQNTGLTSWPSKTKIIYHVQNKRIDEKWLPKYIDSGETLEILFSTLVNNNQIYDITQNEISTFCTMVYQNDDDNNNNIENDNNEHLISKSEIFVVPIHFYQNNEQDNDDDSFISEDECNEEESKEQNKNIHNKVDQITKRSEEEKEEEKENDDEITKREEIIEQSIILPIISRASSTDSTEYSDDEFESVSTSLRLDASTGEVIPLNHQDILIEQNTQQEEQKCAKFQEEEELKEEEPQFNIINILNEKIKLWNNEINLLTSMGFQFNSMENLVLDLENYLRSPNGYRQEDLQLLIDHILLD